jgi:ABC-type transporter Mla subunit MlaD
VRQIRLTPDIPPKVAVEILLEPQTPVRRDTQAALRGSIVTGIQYVELEGGSEEAGPMEPGGMIPGSVRSLVDFRDRLARIADLATRILQRFEEDFLTDENAERASQLLEEMAETSNRLSRAVEAFAGEDEIADVARMVDRVTTAASSVQETFGDWNERRDDVYGGLQSTKSELDLAIADLREVLARARDQLGGDSGTGGAGGPAGLMRDLSRTTTRLEETLDLIEADPSILLRGREIPQREFER